MLEIYEIKIVYTLFIISIFVEIWLTVKNKQKKKLDSNLDNTEANSKNKPKKSKTSKGAKFFALAILLYFVLFLFGISGILMIFPKLSDSLIIMLIITFIPIAFVIGVIIDFIEYLNKNK